VESSESVRARARRGGDHWFEPSTAHSRKSLCQNTFGVRRLVAAFFFSLYFFSPTRALPSPSFSSLPSPSFSRAAKLQLPLAAKLQLGNARQME
jgi:hypothetical protein